MTRNNAIDVATGRVCSVVRRDLGRVTAATASATKPYNGEQGQGAFLSCCQELISHAPHDPPTQEDADESTFDCCIITGGSWSSNDYHQGFCSWPATDSRTGRVPLPGTAVIPHPRSNIRQMS